MYGAVNVHDFIYSTSKTPVSRMGNGGVFFFFNWALLRMGALIGIGAIIDKNTFDGGGGGGGGEAYSEGGRLLE